MKSPVYSSKYFIVVGLFIFLCFTGIWLFVSGRLSKRTEEISIEMATKNYQLKSAVIRDEFNNLISGISKVETILPEIHSGQDFIRHQQIVAALLLSHPKVNKGWYAIINGADTVYKVIEKRAGKYDHVKILTYHKDYISKHLMSNDTLSKIGLLTSVADTLHWMVSSKHTLRSSEKLIFGLDINLKELQHYLWSVDQKGRASAFIIDEKGYYVSNPLEQLIGTRIPDSIRRFRGSNVLSDSLSSYETVNSSYLQVPVLRFYAPFHIGGMNWTMIVDTPVFIADESARGIEKYMTIMFISAAFIILLLIAWSQAKWQKEFILRQKAEMNRQDLLLEKQALNLIAERQQKENALLQLNTLKEKVNPHFLFNSLSSLNALIVQDPELAKSFVVKLSRVYRYVLESYPNGLATVSEELHFVKEYFFLLKIRFGEALAPLQLDVSKVHLTEKIPFMSLQTLIENAVKHNVLSKDKPLKISIESAGDFIVVTNNLQPRMDVKHSGKQGLSYLQSTYAYFGAQQLRYGIEDHAYKCYLPMLKFTED